MLPPLEDMTHKAEAASQQEPVFGVLLGTAEIMAPFPSAMRRIAPHINLLYPEEVKDPACISFALAWDPVADAFRPYPRLQLISSIAAGVNGILACPSLPPDVPVVRIAGKAQAQMMAGFVLWHVLWHHRGFNRYLANQSTSTWERLTKHDPASVRIGVMGLGCMGSAVVDALLMLGYDVAVFSRSGRHVPADATHFSGESGLARLAARSDLLINLLPLTEATRGILNQTLFQRLPKGAVLIHVGRGEHLVEADLLAALDDGTLSAASLDVFATEPLPRSHPFWRHSRIVITPHDACEPTPEQVSRQVIDSLAAVMAGHLPAQTVDRTAGY